MSAHLLSLATPTALSGGARPAGAPPPLNASAGHPFIAPVSPDADASRRQPENIRRALLIHGRTLAAKGRGVTERSSRNVSETRR